MADLVAAALGVYLGELLLSKFGGRWLAVPTEPTGDDKDGTPVLDSIDDPLGFRVQLHAAPLICDPVLWARQALLVEATMTRKSDEGDLWCLRRCKTNCSPRWHGFRRSARNTIFVHGPL